MSDVVSVETVENSVVVIVAGREERIPMENLGLSMDSSNEEILAAVSGVFDELDSGDMLYTTRKALNTSTIYVYPKPRAG